MPFMDFGYSVSCHSDELSGGTIPYSPQQAVSQYRTSNHHLPPSMPVISQIPPGWSYTQEGGWIYRLPPHPAHHHESPQYATAPMVHSHSISPHRSSDQANQHHNRPPLLQQVYSSPISDPSKPKGILRSAGTGTILYQPSDPPSSLRQVRFRETPDIAPNDFRPHSPLPGGSRSTDQAAREVPKWTLHKSPTKKKRSTNIQSDDSSPRLTEGGGRHTSEREAHSYYPNGNGYHSDPVNGSTTIPPSLKQAHQGLFSFKDLAPGVSGKRSGKTLIRELERIAESSTETYNPPRDVPGLDHKDENRSEQPSDEGYDESHEEEVPSDDHRVDIVRSQAVSHTYRCTPLWDLTFSRARRDRGQAVVKSHLAHPDIMGRHPCRKTQPG